MLDHGPLRVRRRVGSGQWPGGVGAHSSPPVPAFQASSPQDLRLFYEKNKTLVPT